MMKGGDIELPGLEEDGRTTFANLNAEEAFNMAEFMMNKKEFMSTVCGTK